MPSAGSEVQGRKTITHAYGPMDCVTLPTIYTFAESSVQLRLTVKGLTSSPENECALFLSRGVAAASSDKYLNRCTFFIIVPAVIDFTCFCAILLLNYRVAQKLVSHYRIINKSY